MCDIKATGNLDEDDTLLLLMDILEEAEEFFLKDFLADIFKDPTSFKIRQVDNDQKATYSV